jgi:hypothetical protein
MGTALWYPAGMAVPIRWVLVRPAGEPQSTVQPALSTDLTLKTAAILTRYPQH